MLLLSAVLCPIALGACLPLFRFKRRLPREIYTIAVTLITGAMVVRNAFFTQGDISFSFLRLTENVACSFRLDGLGRLFCCLVAFLWPLASLYAFEYMEHEKSPNSFFAWYLMAYGVTLGIATAGDIVTMYIFYELLTLVTLPLVMHGMTPVRTAAGIKYLYYSLFGAALAFAGIMLVLARGSSAAFTPGGVLAGLSRGDVPLLRFGYILVFLGLGVKAAVFPLHAWLPAASVAPTPVTSLLHAVAVVKAGVFAVIRVTFYSFGADLIRGSAAQWIPFGLAAFTIVFGSVMAVREKHFKRRLVYSTVSNLSYILLGAALLSAGGLTGALLHMIYHALMKFTLFSVSGAVTTVTGKERVPELSGLGKRMPVTFAVFLFSSLAMTGIPPLSGFHSKWVLATAGIAAGGPIGIISVSVLILSAILTAGYLLFIAYRAWFSPDADPAPRRTECGWRMTFSMLAVSLTTLTLSLFSGPLTAFISSIAAGAV